MIPGPEIISRLYRKWSWTGNGRLAIKSAQEMDMQSIETQKTLNIFLNMFPNGSLCTEPITKK